MMEVTAFLSSWHHGAGVGSRAQRPLENTVTFGDRLHLSSRRAYPVPPPKARGTEEPGKAPQGLRTVAHHPACPPLATEA